MPDELIKELWQIKDCIAQEHGYNLETLVTYLHTKKKPAGQRVVDLRATREATGQGGPGEQSKGGRS
jgi:hypothetical protein